MIADDSLKDDRARLEPTGARALAALLYALMLVRATLARRAVPRLEAIALGAITNFFDTLPAVVQAIIFRVLLGVNAEDSDDRQPGHDRGC